MRQQWYSLYRDTSHNNSSNGGDDKGIFDGVRRQLRSVIEWSDPDPEALFHRWTDNGDEIKNASKLIVNPGQGCIFVYRGKVEAVLEESGTTDLATENIPFWTTITKFMQAIIFPSNQLIL